MTTTSLSWPDKKRISRQSLPKHACQSIKSWTQKRPWKNISNWNPHSLLSLQCEHAFTLENYHHHAHIAHSCFLVARVGTLHITNKALSSEQQLAIYSKLPLPTPCLYLVGDIIISTFSTLSSKSQWTRESVKQALGDLPMVYYARVMYQTNELHSSNKHQPQKARSSTEICSKFGPQLKIGEDVNQLE